MIVQKKGCQYNKISTFCFLGFSFWIYPSSFQLTLNEPFDDEQLARIVIYFHLNHCLTTTSNGWKNAVAFPSQFWKALSLERFC